AGADTGSPYTVVVTAAGATASASQTFTWAVAPLALTNPGDQASTAGAAVSLPLLATAPAGATLAFSANGLPLGLSIDPSTGTIGGTLDPAADTLNPYVATVTVTDGTHSASQSFQW